MISNTNLNVKIVLKEREEAGEVKKRNRSIQSENSIFKCD